MWREIANIESSDQRECPEHTSAHKNPAAVLVAPESAKNTPQAPLRGTVSGPQTTETIKKCSKPGRRHPLDITYSERTHDVK